MRAFNFIGAGDRSRTCDLRITNALLYLLSYTGAKSRIIGGSVVGLKPVYAPTQQSALPACASLSAVAKPVGHGRARYRA